MIQGSYPGMDPKDARMLLRIDKILGIHAKFFRFVFKNPGVGTLYYLDHSRGVDFILNEGEAFFCLKEDVGGRLLNTRIAFVPLRKRWGSPLKYPWPYNAYVASGYKPTLFNLLREWIVSLIVDHFHVTS